MIAAGAPAPDLLYVIGLPVLFLVISFGICYGLWMLARGRDTSHREH